MNPLLQEALKDLVKWALTFLAGYFVSKGIWTQEQAIVYVGSATMAILTGLWTLWKAYGRRLKIVTALASPAGTTEKEVERLISAGQAPPATLQKHESPYLPRTGTIDTPPAA